MAYAIDKLVILGLGLIGGSLACALREQGFCRRYVAWGHREASLRRGVELGVIDEYTLDLDTAVASADVLAICTPTLTAATLLEQILPALPAQHGPVVTDVASVKGSLRDAARRAVGHVPPRLVLGHPIAGSEHSGVEAARADLFVRHRVILTPERDTDPQALALVRRMWEAVGADVLEMDIEQHDQVLALTSHLPHALAYTLVDALAQSDASEAIFRCAAGGFRDFTRIASSDPVMWRDIALANRDALLTAIDRFDAQLATMRAAVAAGDGAALLATFSRAKQARDAFAAMLAGHERGLGSE